MFPRISTRFSLALFCCITVLMTGTAPAQTGSVASEISPAGAAEHFETLPTVFRRNAGQWSPEILYSADARGGAARFMQQGVSFAYTRALTSAKQADRPLSSDEAVEENRADVLVWNVRFEGAKTATAIAGENEHPGVTSYFLGSDPANHHRNVPEAGRVWYRGLYPQIDLRYGSADGALKYDYIVRPGGDPSAIRMRCEGIEGVRVNDRGELEIETAWGVITEAAPVSWQEIDGVRRMVDVRYQVLNDTTVGFSIHAGYRPGHELVIDPVILGWSTFVGGGNGGDGYLLDIALDTAGNIYGSGHYNSGFPTTPGVYQRTNQGDADIFVFKLDRSGSRLLYATYIGGRDNDSATGIAVTPAGEAIICGTTHSDDFPTSSGAFASQLRGNSDLLLAKLNASGNALVFSTYMGGRYNESRARLALDSSGDIYLGGTTGSVDFPVTPGVLDANYGGADDAVIARFSPDGRVCRFATFLGSRGSDTLTALALDTAGNIVAVGTTNTRTFPVTATAFDRTGVTTGTGGWLTTITPDGRAILASTLLRAQPRRVVVAPNGDVVVAGDLPGGISNRGFSATPGVFDTTYNGGGDAVLMRVSGGLDTLKFAAYLGGTGEETVTGLAIATDGDILIGGSVYHSLDDLQRPDFTPIFPLTSCALDKTHTYDARNYFQGQYEGFFSRVSGDGTRLHYSTLLGGRSHDYKVNVAVPNSSGEEVVISLTSHSSDFPTTSGAYQRAKLNGNEDQPVVLVLKPTVTALFDADTTGCGSVAFTDRSFGSCLWHDSAWTPTSWRWEFGDGAISTERSPVHEYLKPGSYKVKLVVGDLTDSITKTVEVKSARGDAFVRLHVDRTHQAVLGSDVTIPVILDDDPDTLRSTTIAITFRYDTTMMAPVPFDADQLDRLVEGTPIEGWDLRIQQPQAGVLLIRATSPDGEVLHGPDTLLRLDFTTFLRAGITTLDDSIWTTELQVDATLDGRYCTRLETSPGQLTLGLCGLQYRLIDMMDFSNKLGASQPNPFNPATEIPFSIAFDGPAVLEVLDASGRRVAVLVDDVMTAGDYVARWDATDYPSGVYYYRLRSGRWSQTRQMVVVK